jgi:hypothetical protein
MRLISTILFSGVVAFGVVAFGAARTAMAQDTTTQSPEKAQKGPQKDHRGEAPGHSQGMLGRRAPDARVRLRAGPAFGGVVGTVYDVSTSSFVISTSAGRKVTVEKTPSTTYRKGTSASSASAITKGESVLVIGMVDFEMDAKGTTITTSRVIVQPTNGSRSATSSVLGVVPLRQGAPPEKKNVGQVPANYTEGSGMIVGGTEATKATLAALAQKTGGIINRVVKLSDGEYEVHNVGVNWPHHIFVNQDFKYVGAN